MTTRSLCWKGGEADVILTIPNDFELSLIGDSPKRIGIDVNGINAMKGGLGSQYMVQLVMQTFGELQQEKSVVVSPDLFTVQNRYNPTLDYKHFMIPALMIMLLVMICGFLPAFESRKRERNRYYRANQCYSG